MKVFEHLTRVMMYDDTSELSDSDVNLMDKAREAAKVAYAPYSKFKVGSAMLMESGNIGLGSNQENASYPVTICAERSAIGNVTANYPGEKILAVAIYVDSEKELLPTAPCGMCRQALLEMEDRQGVPIRILLKGSGNKIYTIDSVKELLPLPFSGSSL